MTDLPPVVEAERVASRRWNTHHDQQYGHASVVESRLPLPQSGRALHDIILGRTVAPTEQRQVRPERTEALGTKVIERLRILASLAPGWDGDDADPIDYSTAFSALVIALQMSRHAADPSVAPMVDGSLILRWTFEDGAALEIVVEEGEALPTYAMLSRDGVVEELAIDGEATLRALLAQQGRYGDSGIRRATYSL